MPEQTRVETAAIEAEQIAEAIEAISEAAAGMLAGGLQRRTLVLLIHDAIPTQIREALVRPASTIPSEQPREGTRGEGCQHDSTRVDGWLDDCCLRCGASGYFKDGHYVDPTGKQTMGHPSGKTLIWPEPAQPEQPRGEEARVDPACQTHGCPDPAECEAAGGCVDPAPPRGEGDDLAARLEDAATTAQRIGAKHREEGNSAASSYYRGQRNAYNEAAELARVSTHPEQSARVDPEDVTAIRTLADEIATIGVVSGDRTKWHGYWAALSRVIRALEPASPTPTEARVDPDPLCSVCGHPRSDHDDGKGEAS